MARFLRKHAIWLHRRPLTLATPQTPDVTVSYVELLKNAPINIFYVNVKFNVYFISNSLIESDPYNCPVFNAQKKKRKRKEKMFIQIKNI